MKDEKLPRAGKALLADSMATVTGAVLGTSTMTSYIESTAGVAAGARTALLSLYWRTISSCTVLFTITVWDYIGSNCTA